MGIVLNKKEHKSKSSLLLTSLGSWQDENLKIRIF